MVLYHAGLSDSDRRKAQEAFVEGSAAVAVATVAFGMVRLPSTTSTPSHLRPQASTKTASAPTWRARLHMSGGCHYIASVASPAVAAAAWWLLLLPRRLLLLYACLLGNGCADD